MNNLNTDINIIGSIADLELILDLIRNWGTRMNSSKELTVIRTEKSKSRIIKGINSAFLSFLSYEHQDLFFDGLFTIPSASLQRFVLFLQFNFTNKLFYEINNHVLIPAIHNGRTQLNTETVTAYIFSMREQHEAIRNWSETTIKTIATKYVSILKKLGMVDSGKNNNLIVFMPSEEMLVYFIYFVKTVEPGLRDLLRSKYLSLLFMNTTSLLIFSKSLWLKEYFEITTTGENLQIEMKFQFTKVADAISKRYKTKI